MKDCHTRARAPPPPPCRAVPCRAVLVARGRSDLGPNIPFKRLRILPGVMTVMITFPVLMCDRFCPLFFSLLLTAYKNGEGGLFQGRELSHTNCKQHIPVPSSASTERVGEQASEITDRRDTLARVCGRSDF
jgi:hypothetical protein